MANPVAQAAALPVRNGKICLVTSSGGGRWVIPKGMIERGHSPAQTAAAEAWEEAGLIGSLSDDPIGSFPYVKEGRIHRVTVFFMAVTEVERDWPERFRRREWFTPETAMMRIAEPGLRQLIEESFEVALAGGSSPERVVRQSSITRLKSSRTQVVLPRPA